MCKEVKILSKKILSLIDTGSQVTLMKESVWNQLGSPSLINSGNILTGFGLSKTHVISSFNSTVSIGNQEFPVKIIVVPNHSMNFDISIGCNLIKQANLTITPDSVMFSKPQIEVSDVSPQPFVFAITDDILKFDIGPEIPKQTRNDVEALLICYRSNKIKTTDIELSITVTDDKPIYHSPRRLPFTERDIVDKQIDEWTQNGVIEPCSSAYASQVLVVHKKDGPSTSLPRANGQVERINRTIIPVLSKMSEDDPTKWFKHVPSLQEVLNSTFQRSINTTPFELLFGTQINNKTDLRIQQLIDEQLQLEFNENRELLRKAAKTQIIKVQNENKKSYNLRRKSPYLYSVKDLVAIKKTQQGPGQKLCNKFIGPYKITQVKPNDTYNVEKCGNFDGPTKTSTCAEYLKPWPIK
ncbi:integrase catalytic domain-containing protein [Trichonephila clavipes]|nr:integrase catalytic domain-containing protein [Trichonephila clavipes]